MEVLSSSSLWDLICKCVRCPFSAICLFMVDKSFFDDFNVFCWITWEFMARFCADYNSCYLIGRLCVCCQQFHPLLQFEAAGERYCSWSSATRFFASVHIAECLASLGAAAFVE
ncbi:hypothetical protein TIFTF001_050417 [Ficus carica]|uniref:Uncharacterized protein n=1 Tax=Ficus carica TaxID=3494 RepID=A0AA87ZF93_FICCA|nr:hypothetical protein TIFTF001_050417 [Ficus carica]